MPPVDRDVVNKLKQEAESTMSSKASWKCLKQRRREWIRENPIRIKYEDYATSRQQLDKATKSMCPRYLEITTRKTNWPKVNTEIKRKLLTYVEKAPFEKIMESKTHRMKVNRMTYMTTSDKVCYWCLSEECLHIRRFHTNPGYTKIDRGELDSKTMNRCAVYNRKQLEAHAKQNKRET